MPINIDLFAIINLLGFVQAIFLVFFFLNKKNRAILSNKYLGLLILSLGVISFDSFLGYTNYMFKLIYLVDFSEPLAFAIGPLYYLFIQSKISYKNPRYYFYHFIPFIIYFLYSALYHFTSDLNYKYNAYVSAYHPEKTHKEVIHGFQDPIYLKGYVNELILLSLIIYIVLMVYRVFNYRKSNHFKLRLYRFLSVQIFVFTFVVIVFIVAKLTHQADLGDYFITSATTLAIYILSFYVIKNSLFFNERSRDKKYEKSSLNDEQKQLLINKISHEMEANKYYLENDCSLPNLAKKVGSSSNNVSQVINECFNQSFFDLLANYRVEYAKELIQDRSRTNEDIAYSVGYNSTNAFYKAFKKICGKTPSQYRNSL